MLNIGMTELLIFGIIALLVLGPEKLPEAVRFVGKWYGKAKRTVSTIQNDFDRELRLSELREEMQAELKRIQELEAKMQAQMDELNAPILAKDATAQPLPTATSVASTMQLAETKNTDVTYHPVTAQQHLLSHYTPKQVPQATSESQTYSTLKVAV